MEKIIFTDESVKGTITDSISENLTDTDLESSQSRKIQKGQTNMADHITKSDTISFIHVTEDPISNLGFEKLKYF